MPLQSVVYYGHYMYTGYTHISYTVLAGLVTCWAACRWFVLFTGPKLDQFASFVQRVGVLWLETEMAGYFQNSFISFSIRIPQARIGASSPRYTCTPILSHFAAEAMELSHPEVETTYRVPQMWMWWHFPWNHAGEDEYPPGNSHIPPDFWHIWRWFSFSPGGIFPTTWSENWDSSDFMTQTCLVFRAKVRGFSLDGTDPLPAEVVARTGISKMHGYI